jgi:hypothetical protein
LSAKGGRIERAFESERGNVIRDEGDRKRGEPVELEAISESTVLEVAGSWSVDPSTLAQRAETFEHGFSAVWHRPATGPRWADVLGGAVGAAGVMLIEIAAILALGRLFGRTGLWWVGVAVGVALAFYSTLEGEKSKLKKPALLIGVALALGAVLGGAFPFRPD